MNRNNIQFQYCFGELTITINKVCFKNYNQNYLSVVKLNQLNVLETEALGRIRILEFQNPLAPSVFGPTLENERLKNLHTIIIKKCESRQI
jgi:hypothetical protein